MVTTLTAIAAVLGVWLRLPGMVLAGLTPNWPLMWVVCWSVRRPTWMGVMGGVTIGLLQDALTNPSPSHAISLGLVGFLTSRLQKSRYVKEDFISVALIVFGMVAIAETTLAIQWIAQLSWVATDPVSAQTLETLWVEHQTIALRSAVLSSLWAPAIYLPLSLWWQQFEDENPSV